MKRKLNKKSLYQEGGAMSSTNPDDNSMPLAKDISGQMEMGVPAINIYKDLISQYIPQDEIDEAFQQLGYSPQDVSKLSDEVSKIINSEMQQSSLSSEIPEAQYGGIVNPGFVDAPGYYLPENLGQKGDIIGAAAFLGESLKGLLGGKDKDGDGFKDGALRQLGDKQKGFKNFKNQKLQSFIPGTASDTIDDSDGYDPQFEVENYLKQAEDKERSRLSLSEPGFPVTSPTTSKSTTASTIAATAASSQTPMDYSYLDPAISEMLDFEGRSGGYDSSMGAYGLTNLGANRYMMGPNSLNMNSSTFKADLTERIKQDYAPSLKGFAQDAQPAMLDYAYNTGADPRIYMLDAYLKGQGQSGLSNRGAYKDAMQDYSWTDKGLEKQFNTEYDKYKDAIGNLSGQDQLKLMNEGRNFYYNNINQVNGQPNPAAQATWLQRPFYKKGGSLTKYQTRGEVMLPEVTVTPYDNVQPNLDNTFDTIAPDFTEIEDVNKNGIPDYLEGVDPASPGVGKMLPEVPASPFDNVMPDMTNTFDDVQSSASTDTTDEDLPMYGKSPYLDAFGKVSDVGVAGANLANEFFQNKKASDAEKELRYSTMADKIYGAYNERPGSRGMYDVNTGLAQPDNLDVGYARMGKEVSADLEMLQKFMGGGKVYDDMFTSYYKKGGEFEPHIMYDPETGEGYMAEKMEDHLRMKEMGYLHKEEMKEKKQQGGEQTPEMESYLEALGEMKIARQAIGTNDEETLGRIGLKNPYNTNNLARDFSYLQQLRQNAGLGAGEEAKILFPHVGQQIRGAANRMLGTNYEQGGEVEVDNQTLAALIAAGADIEIL